MTTHLFDKLWFITLKKYFFVLSATGTALSTFLEKGLQVVVVGGIECHDMSPERAEATLNVVK